MYFKKTCYSHQEKPFNGRKVWPSFLYLLLFLSWSPFKVHACGWPAESTPPVEIKQEPDTNELRFTLRAENYRTFEANPEENCACGLGLPPDMGEVLMARAVFAGTDIPVPGLENFQPNTNTNFPGLEGNQGLSMEVSQFVPGGLNIDMVFFIESSAEVDRVTEVIAQLKGHLETRGRIATGGANAIGVPDHHVNIVKPGVIETFLFKDFCLNMQGTICDDHNDETINDTYDAYCNCRGRKQVADFEVTDFSLQKVADEVYDVAPKGILAYADTFSIPVFADLFVNDIKVATDNIHYIRAASNICQQAPNCSTNCQIDVTSGEGIVDGRCISYGTNCLCVTNDTIDLWPFKNIHIPDDSKVNLVLDPDNLVEEFDESNNEFLLGTSTGFNNPKFQVEVFPNPFDKVIQLKINSLRRAKVELRLLSIVGEELVLTQKNVLQLKQGEQEHVISILPEISPGVYLLQLTFEDGQQYTQKVFHQ